MPRRDEEEQPVQEEKKVEVISNEQLLHMKLDRILFLLENNK